VSVQPGPHQVVVEFSAEGSAEARVYLAPDVTIGQLALAAVELTELAREARAGERVRQANDRLAAAQVAQQLQKGRRT